jgi:CubicO group peptidase (beta-lactamase class C family)
MSTDPTSNLHATPVRQWKNGFDDKTSRKLRSQYNVMHMQIGDDPGVYMFSNLAAVMPTMRVARGGEVSNLDYQPNPSIANISATTHLGTLSLAELMEHEDSRLRGIVVVQKGNIVFESYPGMQENSSHLWMSSSKTITSLLVELLEQQGLINTQAFITDYMDEFLNTDWENVKVENLLHMSSGMDLEEKPDTVSAPSSPVARAFMTALAGNAGDKNSETISDIMKEVRALRAPNEAFEYSTFNTMMLGYLIERVTGKCFTDIFSELVWSKVGMEGDGIMALTPHGDILNGGIFSSRLRDMARFGLLYTPSWSKVSKEQIVTNEYLTKIQTADRQDQFMLGQIGPEIAEQFNTQKLHNAYQWDAVFEDGDMYKCGRNGQCLYVSPSRDIVVVWNAAILNCEFWYPQYARNIALELSSK